MKLSEVFKSKYIKAEELEGDTVLTITDVKIESLGQGRDAEDKPILYFEEIDKGLVCNRVNAGTIGKLYGNETDDWIGKRVTLYATEVEFKGDVTLGVRVRLQKPGGGNAPSRPAASKPATGNGAAPASGKPSPEVIAARSEAWAAFTKKTPDADDATRKSLWASALKSAHPGKAERALTAEDWQAFGRRVTEEFNAETGEFEELPF